MCREIRSDIHTAADLKKVVIGNLSLKPMSLNSVLLYIVLENSILVITITYKLGNGGNQPDQCPVRISTTTKMKKH